MLLWRDYFPRGTIAGLDLLPVELEDDSGRIHIYQGSQSDPVILDRIGTRSIVDRLIVTWSQVFVRIALRDYSRVRSGSMIWRSRSTSPTEGAADSRLANSLRNRRIG
jgi:hypothetical protein